MPLSKFVPVALAAVTGVVTAATVRANLPTKPAPPQPAARSAASQPSKVLPGLLQIRVRGWERSAARRPWTAGIRH